MSTRMLIDARHAEETRVAIVKGSRVEDFDYESAAKRQIKGNIYLARITRVEPSLQACFVEYGGNRHGFLAFSEIHPDYYQIPAEDREKMIELEREEELAETNANLKQGAKSSKTPSNESSSETKDSADEVEGTLENTADSKAESVAHKTTSQNQDEDTAETDDVDEVVEVSVDLEEEEIEAAEHRRNMRALSRRYKIQEVIKRRQVMLIQVVKEERGNKGAALTTYISLAGRYCVLMPNSTHSGGISRKISNIADRKRLKSMMTSLNLPQGMGCIVRTAGMARTKLEVKRDLDYLLRLWNGIRDLTLKSVAPANVYEEGNLIKRSIRDLFSKDIDEILVEGNEGYLIAKNFITMLMPSNADKITHYEDGAIPLFNRYQVESQLEAMYNPTVQLKSGGYIVINPTEALISVDVNSGRATKEKNIEETAVKTNLEAAEELGRQLRLRDMAGLIVIDFIDMEDRGNNRAVERRLKDVLKNDRARIQIGRISSFGLLEMSRQRLRPNVLEASMMVCKHCDGTGVVRNVESAALQSLRALEDEGIRGRSAHLKVSLNRDVAIYMLNKKRADLYDLEKRYALEIEVHGRRDLGPSEMEVERENIITSKPAPTAEVMMSDSIEMDPIEDLLEDDAAKIESADMSSDEETIARTRTRRRRRGRGRGRTDEAIDTADASETRAAVDDSINENTVKTVTSESAELSDELDDKPKSRRRRGRRGGRRRKGADNHEGETGSENAANPTALANDAAILAEKSDAIVDAKTSDDKAEKTGEKPKRPRRRRGSKKTDAVSAEVTESKEVVHESMPNATEAVKDVTTPSPQTPEKPKATRRPRSSKAKDEEKKSEAEPSEIVAPSLEKSPKVEADAPKEEKVAKPRRGRPKKADIVKDDDAKTELLKAEEPKANVPAKEVPKTVTPKVEAIAETIEADADKPSRSGWWNKTFG